MANKLRIVCTNCGAQDDSLEGLGPLCVIRDTEYNQLRALFLKQVDDYCCHICHRSMGLRPTVIIIIDEKSGYLCCLGDRALVVPEEIRKTFYDGLKSDGAQVEAFSTLDKLRAGYAQRIAFMVNRIIQGVETASRDDCKSLFAGGWRDFTSNHFAAATLALSRSISNVVLDFRDDSDPEGVFESVYTFQVKVWLGFCGSWSSELEKGRTLEGDLRRYLSPGALIHNAADEFLRVTESTELWTPVGKFCLEAVRASLHVWRNKSNARQREWADLFVDQEVKRRVLGEQSPPHLIAMEINEERARDTIPYEQLFDSCARQFGEHGLKVLDQLQEIGKKVGYPHLINMLTESIRPLPEEGQAISIDKLLDTFRDIYKGDSPDGLLITASKFLDILTEERSPENLGRLADGLKVILGEGIEIHAMVETWLCMHLLRIRFPNVVIKRIGDEAEPWEFELSPIRRRDLWTERSNALRYCGRNAEAITVAEAVISDLKLAGKPIIPTLHLNLGILYREAGWHEKALNIFQSLLPDAGGEFRLNLLDSIMVTYSKIGGYAKCIPYLEEAIKLAKGPLSKDLPKFLAMLASVKTTVGAYEEARSLLRDVKLDDADDPRVLLPYASAWINLLQHSELPEDKDRRLFLKIVEKIKKIHDVTLQSGDIQIHMNLVRILAILADLISLEERKIFWEQLDIDAREFEGSPDPMALLALARDVWAEGDAMKAKNLLLEVPSAIVKQYGTEHNLSLKINSLHLLRRKFEELADLAYRANSLMDLRLIAELQRDMLGRIDTDAIGDKNTEFTGFIEPDTQTIGQLEGPIAVFEWVDTPKGVVGLATFVATDGAVIESGLTPIKVDLDQLAERVTQRLSGWFPSRTGTPLDLHDWQTFESWLSKELEGRLPEGGRLVIIEHEEVSGLQWHLAAASRWRVSYALSWSVLLSPRQTIASIKDGPIGLAMVPKYREWAENLRALESSVSRTKNFAAQSDLELKSSLGKACDHDALVSILESTKVAKVLCHGFVDPDEDVVALMVGYNGELPLSNSVAANTPSGRRHRFDWRDCQHLKSAPIVLFSAACKTGQSHHAGLGEKLGLFSILRRAGTRSVVAPRWDIEPAVVLPILDDAMERYLRTGAELGEALHAACSEASEVLPPWQAWALALEGDWK